MSVLDLGKPRDGDLINEIVYGGPEAFVCLFNRYAPTAMALAYAILRQRHLAEEVVQEAFLAVWRDPGGYRADRGTVRSWLLSIVHHRAVDLVRHEGSYRNRAAMAAAKEPIGASADPGEVVSEEIGMTEKRKAVRRALRALRPEQRQIIELMYFGALSQTQISVQLSLPLGTVKSRALLGMRRLRAALDPLDDEPWSHHSSPERLDARLSQPCVRNGAPAHPS